jgi:hypothetical protein
MAIKQNYYIYIRSCVLLCLIIYVTYLFILNYSLQQRIHLLREENEESKRLMSEDRLFLLQEENDILRRDMEQIRTTQSKLLDDPEREKEVIQLYDDLRRALKRYASLVTKPPDQRP